jgi:transcription antitermination factor NusG
VDNLATSGLRLPNQPWYCGRVSPGRERAFERGLRRFAIPTYFPVHLRSVDRPYYDWRIKATASRPYTREFPLFPGYVFAAFDQSEWPLIRERIAYKPNWLNFGSGPVQIPVELIEQLQANERDGFVQLQSDDKFQVGDELKITEGILAGRVGLLASDPDQRVLTLHLIAESYALQSVRVVTKLRIDRSAVRLASY